MLLNFLNQIQDQRRPQGKQYQLGYILFFSILAVLCGANSYRGIGRFMEVHFFKLDEMFDMGWVKAPSWCTIKNIIKGLEPELLEKAFRDYSEYLIDDYTKDFKKLIALDGKTLRGSFDNMADKKAIHILSMFAQDCQLVIAHHETDSKSNEIPALQEFIQEIGLSNYIFTIDAMHCQKNS